MEFEYYIPFLRGNRKNPSQSTEEPVPGLLLTGGIDYDCDDCWRCCSDNELLVVLSRSEISGNKFCSALARTLNLFPFTAEDNSERKENHFYYCCCVRSRRRAYYDPFSFMRREFDSDFDPSLMTVFDFDPGYQAYKHSASFLKAFGWGSSDSGYQASESKEEGQRSLLLKCTRRKSVQDKLEVSASGALKIERQKRQQHQQRCKDFITVKKQYKRETSSFRQRASLYRQLDTYA
jgi:hypothetical protein